MHSEEKVVFIAAYRNFAIRYILESDIFKQLQKRSDLKFVLFFHDNDVEFHEKRFQNPNIHFEPVLYEKTLSTIKSRANRLFLLVRKCLSGSDGNMRNTTDEVRIMMYGKEQSVSNFRRLEFYFVRLIVAACSRSALLRKIFVRLEAAIFRGAHFDAYFKRYKPDTLIVSSIGYMVDTYFMRAAKRNGCKVVSIIHSWDNPTTKDYRGAEPDLVIVWNELMKKEVEVFHDIPAERIHVRGVAHWDNYFSPLAGTAKEREKLFEQFGLDKKRKMIFYGISSFTICRNTFDVIEELLAWMVNSGKQHSFQLLVRLHPAYLVKQKGKKELIVLEKYNRRIDVIREKYGDLVVFNVPNIQVLQDDMYMPMHDLDDLRDILKNSEVLITEFSTLMIEASIFDVPVINAAMHYFRDTDLPISYIENYTHIKRVLSTGAIRNAYSYKQLFQYIDEYLADKSLDRKNRTSLVKQELTTNTGNAGVQIADKVYEFIRTGT